MNDAIDYGLDGTLLFLPERLNRDPVVLRGLTNDEMWIALGIGAFLGALIGVPSAIVVSSLAVAPTAMIAGMALVLMLGGRLLRRTKRGRPDAWLYQWLVWWLASRCRIKRGNWVLRSGVWSVRRSRRIRPTLFNGQCHEPL